MGFALENEQPVQERRTDQKRRSGSGVFDLTVDDLAMLLTDGPRRRARVSSSSQDKKELSEETREVLADAISSFLR